MRKEIQISAKGLSNLDEYLREIGRLFDFPSYYCATLDDLYEFLQSYSDKKVTVFWTNAKEASEILGNDYERLKEVFERVDQLNPEFKFITNE